MAKFYSIDIDPLNEALRAAGMTPVPTMSPSLVRVPESLGADLEQIRERCAEAWDEGVCAALEDCDYGDHSLVGIRDPQNPYRDVKEAGE